MEFVLNTGSSAGLVESTLCPLHTHHRCVQKVKNTKNRMVAAVALAAYAALLHSCCLGFPLDNQSTSGNFGGSTEPKFAPGRPSDTSSSDSDESPSASGKPLTRLSFSDLRDSSSSSSYSSNCCDVLPEICDAAGKCKRNVSECVSFCICARSSALPWCPGELERLRQILNGQRGSGESPASGRTSSADNQGMLGSLVGGAAHGGLSLGPEQLGGALAGNTGGGESSQDALPTGTLSSSSIPSSSFSGTFQDLAKFGSFGSLNLPGLHTGGAGDHPSGSQGSDLPTRPSGHVAPPLAAIMDGGEEGDSSTKTTALAGAGSTSLLDALKSPFINITTLNNKKPTLESTAGTGNASDIDVSTYNRSSGFFDLDPSTTLDSNDTDLSDLSATTFLSIGEDWCGPECDLQGGRCVLGVDFKPHCVFDLDSNPCHSFLCVHGTCVETAGKYSCQCEENWVGVRCEKECPLDCGENGYCGRVQNGSIACICHWNYTGEHCDEPWPEFTPDEGPAHRDVVTVWQITAGCLGAAALTLLLLVMAAYITWRQQWLPMRRLVHYFQQYEEDDGKEYDAFISYKSSARDEKFVLQQLYPRLEKDMDFKLCIHLRDFPPGETIADNIIQAIENSRRTIMVLSPAYVDSEWCRLEYQKAQHEMLKLKHKIIPVIMDDAEYICAADKNLKTILDTVTYIKWPGVEDTKKTEKFWKLLELSMPKKNSGYSRSLSSTGSCSSERPLTSVSVSCFNNIVENMSDNLYPQRSLSFCSSIGDEADSGKERADSQERGEDDSFSGSDGDGDPSQPTEISEDSAANADQRHVTSDDHIVEIRELPGNKIRVKPWFPARLAPPVEAMV